MNKPRLAIRSVSAVLLALAATQASAACYTVYDSAGRVVQQSAQVPASAAEADSVPEGGRVILNGQTCDHGAEAVTVAEQVMPSEAGKRHDNPTSAPLLTNVGTAASAHAPYAVVGQGIAVVAPANAQQVWQRAPLVHNVVPATPVASQRPMTETVITEWADGRTYVEQLPVQARR